MLRNYNQKQVRIYRNYIHKIKKKRGILLVNVDINNYRIMTKIMTALKIVSATF